MSEVIKQDLKTEALKLALETMNLARAAHGQMLLSDPPQEAWKAWGVSAALTKAMTAASKALADHTEQPLEMVAEQPAQQHIEHCIWARNGNAPCPHVQPAQQKEPVVLTDIEIQNCFQQRSKDKTNEKRLIAEQITKTVLEKLQ